MEAGTDALAALEGAVTVGDVDPIGAPADLTFGPQVADPDGMACLSLSYRNHAVESGLDLTVTPVLFAKFRNSLVGPTAPILLPQRGEKLSTKGSSPS